MSFILLSKSVNKISDEFQQDCYDVAESCLTDISLSDNYAINHIPKHQPSERTDAIMMAIKSNLHFDQMRAEFECKIYKGDLEKEMNVVEAKRNIYIGIERVEEAVSVLHQGLPNGYDLTKSILENFVDLKETMAKSKNGISLKLS